MSKQVLVPLDAALLGFVERAAERESRTVAGQIRHLIVEAMRHAGSTMSGADPSPPLLAAVSRDNLLEIKALVKEMEAERDELVAAEKKNHFDLMAHDEVRLQYLLETIKCLRRHIVGIERLTVGNNHGGSDSRPGSPVVHWRHSQVRAVKDRTDAPLAIAMGPAGHGHAVSSGKSDSDGAVGHPASTSSQGPST